MKRWTACLLALAMILTLAAGAAAEDNQVITFRVNRTVQNDTAFGRCAAPEGYTVLADVNICTEKQSVSNPCQAYIVAGRENGPQMIYLSMCDFIAGTGEDAATQDGQYNLDFQTPMLHYMTAAEYCDQIALQVFYPMADGNQLMVSGIDTFPEEQEFFDRLVAKELASQRRDLQGTILSVDDMKYTVGMKAYQFPKNGETYYGFVVTATIGVWITAQGPLSTVAWVQWYVPFTYVMFAPQKDGAEASAAFEAFVMNTTASDQFIKANREMSEALWKILKEKHDIRDCYDYSARRISEETASGDDYSEDRFTDYIFDRNDYTLEDGSHVKVSTAYDYVWEGENGTVYASTGASGQPGGSRRLYPNQ